MSLNYTVRGHGEPLVLIHGLFGSLENLGVIARQLEETHKVISIDLPDHGKSPWSEQFSFDSYAAQIVETLNKLSITKCHILGHSLGGKVAMQIAMTQPQRVASLMVADIAPVEYPPRHNNVFAALQSFNTHDIASRQEADKYMAEHISEVGVRQFLLKSLYKQNNGNFAWRFNVEMLHRDYELLSKGIDKAHDNIDSLSSDFQYGGKVLFIKGGNSDYITMEHQAKIQSLFSNASAKIIAGTGHWLHAEKPFVFAGIVSKFLET